MSAETADGEAEALATELEAARLRQDELEAARRREALETRRRALGDAEETCVALLGDLVDALFQEMQVRSENLRLFARAAQQTCAQVFEGVAMGASEPPAPLERRETQRQQVLRAGRARPAASWASLRRLARVLESKRELLELQVLRFPTSAAVWTARGRRQGDARAEGSAEGSAEWGLAAHDVAGFLHELLAAGLVRAQPRAVRLLLAANREALAKKQQSQARVTLTQLQLWAHKALLAAEEDATRARGASGAVDASPDDYESATFQTEVPPSASSPSRSPSPSRWSCYQEEAAPVAGAVDRRVPSQVARKPELSAAHPATRLRSRQLLLLLAPAPKPGSRWLALRSRVAATPRDEASQLEGDSTAMALRVASGGERKAAEQLPDESEDAAALANIFALGTPRQLSASELARRQDLLAQLEREQLAAARRRAALALALAAGAARTDERLSQGDAAVTLSPSRPDGRGRGRGRASRSKFELERQPLGFAVSEGNAHRRCELLDAALCSPIQRPAMRPPTRPETPGRPVQTASTAAHLPQLESSRLAVGVSAVVRGVQKRGPRRHPSRKSRLQLHNYSAAFDGLGELEDAPEHDRLPLLPAVSPIKASPHRKHVAFAFSGRGPSPETAGPPAPAASTVQPRRRPAARASQQQQQQQQHGGWEPRTRNRHVAAGRRFRKAQRLVEDPLAAADATRAAEKAARPQQQRRLQPPAAPRRDVLPRAAHLSGD